VRRVRRGEAAGLIDTSGEPCGICFSDTGFLTGCDKEHIICAGCVRTGLRICIGDAGQTEGLLCGCLSNNDQMAFTNLALKADLSLQELLAKPPGDSGARREFELELTQVRSSFQVPGDIPKDLYSSKVAEWQENVKRRATEVLYHACSHPGCAMDNWLLRSEFDEMYRPFFLCEWVCKRGHKNSVLPPQAEIDEMNRNILLHPEYYTEKCGYDSMSLRRFRMCPRCVDTGLLMFAVHEDGCKQWPGATMGHQHCFCFRCTGIWEKDCNHGNQCDDPGIQQVRKTANASGHECLEIGFVNAEEYMDWLYGRRDLCPPTVFKNGDTVLGTTRQGQLRMEDTDELQKQIQQGTH